MGRFRSAADRYAPASPSSSRTTGMSGRSCCSPDAIGFTTGNRGLTQGAHGVVEPLTVPLTMRSNHHINPLFDAVVEATEEAIVNAMLQAGTVVGRDGITAHGLDGRRLVEVMRSYRRGPGED